MAQELKDYDITGPDGKSYTVTASAEATDEQLIQYVQSTLSSQPEVPQQAQPVAKAPASPQTTTQEPAPLTPFEKTDGTYKQATLAIKDSPEVASAAQALWAKGERNPEVFNNTLAEMFPGSSFAPITAADVANGRRRDAYFKARGIQNPGNFLALEATGVEDPVAPDNVFDTAVQGAERGLANMANSLTGVAALGADAIGADDTANQLLDKYVEDSAKINFNYPRPVESYSDVNSLGDAGLYVADTLGEFAPNITSGLTTGALGKAIAGKVGAAVAAGANSALQETGSIYGQTFEATGEKAPVSSLLAGLAAAGLETILPARILSKIGAPVAEIESKLASRMAKEAGKDFVIEGGTEALQTFIESLPESVITGKSPFTSEMADQMIESFIRGGIGGGTSGAVSGATQKGWSPMKYEEAAPVVVPTARKGSKAYNQELSTATDSVVGHVNAVTERWSNAPTINVHENFKKVDGIENDSLGYYDPETGEVNLNTEEIIRLAGKNKVSVEDQTNAVLYHESLGHYGLDQEFGEGLDYTLSTWVDNADASFQNAIDAWEAKNPGAYDDRSNRDLLVAEEVLADWAQQGYIPRTFYDSFANLVKSIGRKARFNFKYSEREIKAILSTAQEGVLLGTRKNNKSGGKAKYATVWHGSGADFDEFDHSFMSSGEGAQIFGWGTYFSDKKGIGESYRDSIGQINPSWDGVNTGWHQVRENTKSGLVQKFGEVRNEYISLIDDLISDAGTNGSLPRNAEQVGKFYLKNEFYSPSVNKRISEIGLDKFVEEFQPILDEFKKRFKVNKTGKLYEVEIPDNVLWNDWEKPLKEQEHISYLLREANSDIEILPYDDWNFVERRFYETRMKYNEYNHRLNVLQDLINNEEKHPGPDAHNLESYEAEADLLFQRLQEISPKYNAQKREYDNNFHEEMSGEEFYGKLVSIKGGPQQASEFLKSIGIEGNRYTANYMRGGNSEGLKNYVVFSDKTPKIKAKYMRPSQARLDPNDLTAEELFESENAYDILRSATDGYDKITLNLDELKDEANIRDVSVSSLLRGKDASPGEAVRRLFMFDIAAQKVNDRLTELYAKLNNGTWTPKDKDNYLKTLAQYQNLMAKIFGEHSEAGRVLRAIQDLSYTKNKMLSIQDALSGLQNAYQDDESFMKLMSAVQGELEADTKANKKSRISQEVGSLLNISRTIMSSLDASAPLRQGIFFIRRKEFWKNLFPMFKYGMSEQSFQSMMTDIRARPTYSKMAEAGISFANVDGDLQHREEAFMSKISGVKFIRGSNRAYAGFLNKVRADVFDSVYNGTLKENATKVELKSLGDYINNATGRGNLGELNKSAAVLAAGFFSPRLIASRLRILGGAAQGFHNLPPRLRNQARADLAGFIGAASVVILLALMNGADVEEDPRSSDFLKLRWGKTRYDILGGFGQYLTLAARLGAYTSDQIYEGLTDKEGWDHYKSTSTGETGKYEGLKYGGRSAWDAIGDFFRNKFSPNTSLVVDFFDEKNSIGEEFDPVNAVAELMVPMFFQDAYENIEEYGIAQGLAMSAPGFFGVGVQTFTPKNTDPNADVEAPESFEMSDLEDGENDYVKSEGGTVTLKEPARKEWHRRLNIYTKEWMKEEMLKPEWKKMTDKEKADLIADVRNDARKQTKKDMLEVLGLD